MKWFYILAAVLVTGMALAPLLLLKGEGADPYPGQIVRWDSYESEVKSVDPATCGDTTSAAVQGNIYESLYCYHYLKRPPEVIPQLGAEMPQVSEDGLTYTIRLRPGVQYHRNPCFGKEPGGAWATRTMRAEDFVLAFKRCADYHINTGLAWAFLSERIVGIDEFRQRTRGYKQGDFSRYDLPLEGVQAVDDLTLRIRLTGRFPQMVYVLAIGVFAPIPREAVDYWLATEDDGRGGRRPTPLEERRTEFREAAEVVGTGPYLLKTFERKSKIVMVRNPDFRPDFYPAEGAPGDAEDGLLADANRRVPFVDVIHWDYVAEDYASWMRFLSRQTDATGIPRETFEFVVTPSRDLAEEWRRRHIELSVSTRPWIYWIVFNMEDPVVGRSKSLRQALCLSFDVENYIKVLRNGRGKRAVNVLPSSFKGHDEAGTGPYAHLDVEEALRKVRQARSELAAAGQLVDGEIPVLQLDIPGRDAASARQGEFITQQFQKIRVRLKITYSDWPTLQEKVNNKQCQIYTMGWDSDYPDAENFLQLFYTPNIEKQTNNANYSDPEFDRLYEQARVMDDTPDRTALYARMARKIGEDCPVLLLSEPVSFLLYYDWLKNVKPHPCGYGYGKYQRIDEPLRKSLGGR